MNRSRLLTLGCVLTLLCLIPASASAAYGDLDAKFGVGGKVRLSGSMQGVVTDIQLGSDGKTTFGLQSHGGNFVVRLGPRGKLDRGFSGNGKLALSSESVPVAIGLLDGGRLAVLSGDRESTGTKETQLQLFRSNGELDTGFAQNGTLTLGKGATGIRASSLAVQPDSKLLVAGALEGSTTVTTVLRLNVDGTKDSSFGAGGYASVEGASGETSGYGSRAAGNSPVAVAQDGRIFLGIDVVGGTPQQGDVSSGVASFNSDGVRDQSFGGTGIAIFPPDAGFRIGLSKLLVAPNGTVLALSRNGFWGRGLSIGSTARYFRSDGSVLAAPREVLSGSAALLPDSGFVFSGFRFTALLSTLTPNPNFDSRGVQNLPLGSCDYWEAIAADVFGRVVSASIDNDTCDDSVARRQYIVRTLGVSGGRAAPQLQFKKSTGGSLSWPHASHLSIAGTAQPSSRIKRVAVAIRRLDSALLKKHRCRWLAERGTKTVIVKSDATGCGRPHFMPAKGTGDWTFSLQRPMRPGKYRLYVRATTKGGSNNPLSTEPDSFEAFTVKMAK